MSQSLWLRLGFWASIGLGCLSLLGCLVDPLAGAVFAAIYFSVAWGIRRRQFWAAIAGIVPLAGSIVRTFAAIVPGEYFVLGDNRDDSLDSRYFGFIGRSAIVGSPLVIYESFSGAKMAAHLRWNRVFKIL